MRNHYEAYLDIETTGLSPESCQITVIGIQLGNGDNTRFIQLVGDNITPASVLEALSGAEIIYTYNGSRFDLPFINSRLGVRLDEFFKHRDLMYDCWRNDLYGGLKAVERQLGIRRQRTDISGLDAIRLWWRYINYSDNGALRTLLDYNKEDVFNLRVLKDRLIR